MPNFEFAGTIAALAGVQNSQSMREHASRMGSGVVRAMAAVLITVVKPMTIVVDKEPIVQHATMQLSVVSPAPSVMKPYVVLLSGLLCLPYTIGVVGPLVLEH